jgi:hypothetical protein
MANNHPDTFPEYCSRVLRQIGHDLRGNVVACVFTLIGVIAAAILLSTYHVIPANQTTLST